MRGECHALFLDTSAGNPSKCAKKDIDSLAIREYSMRMNDTAFNAYDNLATKIQMFYPYSTFVKWFGSTHVDKALAAIPIGELVELSAREAKGNRSHWAPERCIVLPDGYEHITKCHPFDTSYTKTERVLCQRSIVPHKYQGLRHEDVLRPCLLQKFPWLSRFALSIYEVSTYGQQSEFYVNLGATIQGHRELYVPYEAFFAGDVEAILERNRSYLKWYTHADLIWDEIKCLPTVKKFLTLVA